MSRIILINGRPGAGKSTVAKLLSEKLDSVALLEFDSLIKVKPFEYGEKLLLLGLENSVSVVNNFLDFGFKNIILCAGTTKESHLEFFLSKIEGSSQIHWIYLNVSVEERSKRKVSRLRDDADSLEWFEQVKSKIGTYSGLPKLSGVSYYELDVEGISSQEVASLVAEQLTG